MKILTAKPFPQGRSGLLDMPISTTLRTRASFNPPTTPSCRDPPCATPAIKNFLIDASVSSILKSWPQIIRSSLLQCWSYHLHGELRSLLQSSSRKVARLAHLLELNRTIWSGPAKEVPSLSALDHQGTEEFTKSLQKHGGCTSLR